MAQVRQVKKLDELMDGAIMCLGEDFTSPSLGGKYENTILQSRPKCKK